MGTSKGEQQSRPWAGYTMQVFWHSPEIQRVSSEHHFGLAETRFRKLIIALAVTSLAAASAGHLRESFPTNEPGIINQSQSINSRTDEVVFPYLRNSRSAGTSGTAVIIK